MKVLKVVLIMILSICAAALAANLLSCVFSTKFTKYYEV